MSGDGRFELGAGRGQRGLKKKKTGRFGTILRSYDGIMAFPHRHRYRGKAQHKARARPVTAGPRPRPGVSGATAKYGRVLVPGGGEAIMGLCELWAKPARGRLRDRDTEQHYAGIGHTEMKPQV